MNRKLKPAEQGNLLIIRSTSVKTSLTQKCVRSYKFDTVNKP